MPLPSLAIVACCLATALAHAVVLTVSSDDWLSTPIAGLSQSRWGIVQSAGLLLFGLAHLILAATVSKAVFCGLHRLLQLMFLVLALCLFEATIAFAARGASLSGLGASNWRLIVIACLVGIVMALIWFRAGSINRELWRLNAVFTILWMALAPVGALVGDGWVGGYERLTGLIYVVWVAGIAITGACEAQAEPMPAGEQE